MRATPPVAGWSACVIRERRSRISLTLHAGYNGSAGGTVQALNLIPWPAASVIVLLVAWPALAQAPAEFYKGKRIELDIGLSVGGGYDAYARMLAPTMGKYIPGNPGIGPKNMEGAGSSRLANHLYNGGPKDGTSCGTINRGTGFEPLLGNKGAQF